MVTSNTLNANSTGVVAYNGAGNFTASAVTNHNVLVGGTSNSITSVAPGSSGTVLVSNGASANPSFQAVAGVGSTVTQHYSLVGGSSNSIVSVTPSTAGFVLTSNGTSADPSFQVLPSSAASSATFSAYLSSDMTNVTGDSTTVTILFDTTTSNVGSAYNTSTGIFTAPATGVYLFGKQVTLSTSAASFVAAYTQIVINAGSPTYKSQSFSTLTGASVNRQEESTVILSLSANDTVKIVAFATASVSAKNSSILGSTGNLQTSFWGVRLI
jgi:hypothetical protein